MKQRAIALLARREYGRAELKARLLSSGARIEEGPSRNGDAVDAVLDELAALGLLSDERYANAMVARKAGSYSRRAILETLKMQGVHQETIEGALAEHAVDDETAMRQLWQRRFGQAPADDREKARQVRFLQSRGFALSAIFKLLRSVT